MLSGLATAKAIIDVDPMRTSTSPGSTVCALDNRAFDPTLTSVPVASPKQPWPLAQRRE